MAAALPNRMPLGSVSYRSSELRGDDLQSDDPRRRLIVALDVSTAEAARAIVAAVGDSVFTYKIGMQLYTAEGPQMVRELVAARRRVFLDLKYHDIPNTVGAAVAEAAKLGVSMLTVHAAGSGKMLRAAVEAAQASPNLMVLAVTVLTSLDDTALRSMGYGVTAQELVQLRVRDALACGCDGVIASAHDNPDNIRKRAGDEKLLIATPGIRGPDDPVDDHRRTADAATAIAQGADYLWLGGR